MNRTHHVVSVLLAFALLVGAPAMGVAQGRTAERWSEKTPGSYPWFMNPQGFQEAMFTLTGTLDLSLVPIETPDETVVPTRAAVMCWLCQGGSCDDSGTVGPATFIADVRQQAESSSPIQSLPWEVQFDLTNASVYPANINSYYCRLGFGLASLPTFTDLTTYYGSGPVVPSYYHPETDAGLRALKAAEGSQLVFELAGTIGP